MDFLRKLLKKEPSVAASSASEPPLSTTEDIIATLRQIPVAKPICWIVCYEDRPLQGAPPGSSKPHLLIFASTAQAESFIAGRRRIFMPEPLSVVGVDSASRLKQLTTTPASDSRYEQPPCGLLLNFTYPAGATDGTLSPQEVEKMNANQLVRALGLKGGK
jgi:hypothetical protein